MWIASLALFACSCVGPRWEEPEEPAPEVFLREILPDIVPDIPPPAKLRPCCAFGSDLRVRLGPIPVPWVQLDNIISPEDVGPHRYDNGLISMQQSGVGIGVELVQEDNGLVYTCRGGFLDTAHVRDYADWTMYLAGQVALAAVSGVTLSLPSEGASRTIRIEPAPAEIVEITELRERVIAVSSYLAFQLSVWHEISTWLGWSASRAFPEEASAFSPEDLYSNLVGIKIAGRVLRDGRAGSEDEYNAYFSEIFGKSISMLGGLPAEFGRGAAEYVDGIWWQSEERLPSRDLVLKRNMEIGEVIKPWRVTESHWTQRAQDAIEEYCGGDDSPVLLTNPSTYEGVPFSSMATLELKLEKATAKRLPIPLPEDGVLTQTDFPRLIEAIRAKNQQRYGAGADTPVRVEEALGLPHL
jgi:hypothetical protein